MVIMHNLTAMNGNRMYGINNKKRASATEKLSSGYKINRAADNAAGLAMSEKMRRQIRGLDRGAENIKDGISLVQVADGALDEVTSCLQRINELSIKAYNGTNEEQDREYIQSEITQLITEVQRIADTTTFNELSILKGNPKVPMKIEHDKMIDGYVYQEFEATIPDWLRVTPELKQSNSTGLTLENLDTTSNAVFQTSPGVYEYYGDPNPELDKIATSGQTSGSWSPNIDDKASAIIDFGRLTAATTPTELFGNLFDLIGTSIGVPCGTCTEYYGISFTGSELGLEIKDGGTKISDGLAKSISYLNLSEWKPWKNDPNNPSESTIFDKVRDMMKDHALDNTKPDSEKLRETQFLAKDIAIKLRDETASRIATTVADTENHFNRASKITTPGYEYALMIYDFRDVDKLATEESADSLVQVTAKSWAKIPYSMLKEGTIIEIEQPLQIQCSSNVDDDLPIDLPLLDEFSLGINSYDVLCYDEKVFYSEKYLKELEDWEKDGYHYELRTETIPAQPERTIQKKVLVEDRPRPQPGPDDIYIEREYNPSDVKTIADALSYVSMCRANLGATQNRLEHAYFNNLNVNENTTYAESRIRDTDMAKEMVAFSNLNVLQQAGQAMLSQANQSNQGILSLLQ